MGKKIALLISIVLLVALVFGVYLYSEQVNEEPIQNAGTAQNAVQKPVSLVNQGMEYPMRKHLDAILLIGTDSTEQYEEQKEGVKNFYSYHQADFLMLLVLDNDAETVEILQINRDTMTDVPWLDVLGKVGGTEYKQICLAYNYGDGGAASCKNTLNAVSSLLFDAPIESYIQIPMTAIPVLNDLVGGVPVTITEDMTMIDPAFVAGATVRLNGSQAEKYVRARRGLDDDTNISRMRRQREYLDSFQRCAKEKFNSDSEFVLRLVEKLGDFMQSNMNGQQLSNLIEKLDSYHVNSIRYPEGELIIGQKYYEFYVDKDSLWKIVKGAYC